MNAIELNNATSLTLPLSIPLVLEKAITIEERTWGLMGRKNLGQNQGMLFIFHRPQVLSFWMFNCYIDLSVAYIDSNHVIRGIEDLTAHPDRMDPLRPVRCLKDMKKYSSNEPTCLFFASNAKPSKGKMQYALEVNRGWFTDHHISIGDLVIWDRQNNEGYINSAINLSKILKEHAQLPLLLKLPDNRFYSAWLPESEGSLEITFLNALGEVINREILKGGKGMPPEQKPVAVSQMPAAYLGISYVK